LEARATGSWRLRKRSRPSGTAWQ